MFKRLTSLSRGLSFFQYFIPLKRNGFFLLAFSIFAILLIKREYYGEDSLFNPYLELFAWLIAVVGGLIIGVGFLYTLTCWIYLLIRRDQINADLRIGLENDQKGEVGKVLVKLSLSNVLMPLMGYLKMRVVFEDGGVAGPVVLGNFSGGWKNLLAKEGISNIWLNERKQYDIKGFVISCEDYLELFRFSFYKKTQKTFYLHSPKIELETPEIKPSQSKEMVERIKTSKKVEGDYLNYKDFESGDDVRRIVWKIFAKNKELVVRIPEVINPYASHIHFFGSFYNTISHDFQAEYSRGMLDYYKDIIFNVCLSLEKTERKIKFNIDQPINDKLSVDEKDQLGYQLSVAHWQSELPATDLKVPASQAVVCVSSLIPAEELEELIHKKPVNLFIVRTSRYLDQQHLFNWKNMFLRAERQNELSKVNWLLSGFRRRIKKNEKKIDEIISNNNFQGQVI